MSLRKIARRKVLSVMDYDERKLKKMSIEELKKYRDKLKSRLRSNENALIRHEDITSDFEQKFEDAEVELELAKKKYFKAKNDLKGSAYKAAWQKRNEAQEKYDNSYDELEEVRRIIKLKK